MYRYDAIRPAPRRRARRAVSRPDAALPRRASCPRTSSARCGCRTASTSSGMRRCCGSRSPTGCCRRGSCARSRTSRATTTAATATSPRARTSSSTGRGSKTCPTSSPSWPACEMHAIQTSGNCVRNITERPFRRASRRDEIVDPRPVVRDPAAVVDASSRVRLPAAQVQDRGHAARPTTAPRCWCTTSACRRVHERRRRDRLSRARRRRPGPHADHRPRDPRVPAVAAPAHLPRSDPARLQPLSAAATTTTRRASRSWSRSATPAAFAREVEAEWEHLQGRRRRRSPTQEFERLAGRFHRARLSRRCPSDDAQLERPLPTTARSRTGCERNVHPHKVPGYAIVTLSLKKTGVPPGDVTAEQMDADRRPGRPLQLRRAARLARAEPGARRRARRRTCSTLWQQAEARSGSRRRTSAC